MWKYGLLIALCFAAYLPAFRGQFIWDDWACIVDDDLIHSPKGLWQIWLSRDASDYWPVSFSLFWAAWRLWGPATLGYHLLNILIHSLNSLIIFKIFKHLRFNWAFVAALLFALHPVNVESVAWIFQIKTTLAALFALLSLYHWLLFCEDANRKRYVVALVAFALALLSKTSVVLWPLALLGGVIYQRRKVYFRDAILLAPFFILSLILGLVSLFWYPYATLTGSLAIRSDTFGERILLNARAFWFYLAKDIYPLSLSFLYPKWSLNTDDPLAYIPLLGAVLLFMACLYLSLRGRVRWLWALAYFLIGVVPVLGFFDIYFMRYSYVADHWQYLSIPAFCALVASLIPSRIGYLIASVLFVLTFQRAALFQNQETIWLDTLNKNPQSSFAALNLGNVYLNDGQPDKALAYFEEAAKANLPEASLYNNIGVIYYGHGEMEKAFQYYSKALSIAPSYVQALNNLAAVELNRHDQAGAELHLLQSVTAMPTYYKGYKNLADLYMQQSRFAEASESYNHVLAIRPDDQDAIAGRARAAAALRK